MKFNEEINMRWVFDLDGTLVNTKGSDYKGEWL